MADSIYDISSLYNTYADKYKQTSDKTITEKLSNVSDDSDDEELLEACKGFEEYFLEQVISNARKTIGDSDEDEDGGEYLKMFSDNINRSLAETVTKGGGVGLAQQLYESIKR